MKWPSSSSGSRPDSRARSAYLRRRVNLPMPSRAVDAQDGALALQRRVEGAQFGFAADEVAWSRFFEAFAQ